MSVGKKKSRRHRRANNDGSTVDDADHSGSDSDEEPDVAELESSEFCADNHATCVGNNIDAVLEVFDDETCINLLIGYHEVACKYYSKGSSITWFESVITKSYLLKLRSEIEFFDIQF